MVFQSTRSIRIPSREEMARFKQLEQLGLSPRAINVVMKTDCRNQHDIATTLTRQSLLAIPNCGDGVVTEIENMLKRFDLKLEDRPTPNERIAKLQKQRGEFLRTMREIDSQLAGKPPKGEGATRERERRAGFFREIQKIDREIAELREWTRR